MGRGVLLLILQAFLFCWLHVEENETLGDGGATRGHETKFFVITSQKFIRPYVLRNKQHWLNS